MVKKKKKNKGTPVALDKVLDAQPTPFEVTFHANDTGDFYALSLLGVFFHSIGRVDDAARFLDVADSFQSYMEAKRKSEQQT